MKTHTITLGMINSPPRRTTHINVSYTFLGFFIWHVGVPWKGETATVNSGNDVMAKDISSSRTMTNLALVGVDIRATFKGKAIVTNLSAVIITVNQDDQIRPA